MIRTRTFDWVDKGDDFFSALPTIGWIPEHAAQGWYPGHGFLVAHDVMEHLSDKADWGHELSATGVALYGLSGVRWRSEESIARDILSFAKEKDFEVPEIAERWERPLEGDGEAAIIKFVYGMYATNKKYALASLDTLTVFAKRMLPWVRKGYAAASLVYGQGRGHEMGELMQRLADEVDLNHDEQRPKLGDKLRVSVDTCKLSFKLERI